MKKLLTFLMMFMLMMSSVIAPPPVPQPVRGYLTLNGQSLVGYVIEATNLRTGEFVSGDTKESMVTQSGGFFFDLSFFKQGFTGPIKGVYVGDTIRVHVKGFTDSQATVDFIPVGNFPVVRIDILNEQTVFVCSDGSTRVKESDCPVEEEEEPEPEVVEIETKVVKGDDGAIVEADYGQPIEITLSDNKLASLIDQEIKYDGEGYDVHEEVDFAGVVLTSIDDEDYGLNPYLVVLAGEIEYKYVFEDVLPYGDIHLEEPLEITFLGKELKIIEASSNELTLRTGEEFFKEEGNKFTVLDRDVILVAVGQDSVLIEVDGIRETVNDGEDRRVNDLRVLVDSILYNSYEGGKRHAELVIGLETDEVVKDGDDFELFTEGGETYKWVINLPNSIGVVNQEDYISVDEDEEFKPLGVGESLSLPNDYLVFTFKEVSESEVTDLTFKVKDEFLNVKGPVDAFAFGSDEYDELNIKSDGIFDEDEELITTDKVRIGDSETFLELGSVKIGKLVILLDMSDILYDGISYALEETDFLDYVGMVFRDPKNAVEDQARFKVSVPEERPEITLLISSEIPEEIEVPIEEEEEEETVVVPVDDKIVPPVVPPVTPPVVPPIVTYICEDGTEVDSLTDCVKEVVKWGDTLFEQLVTVVGILLTALGVQWNRGILGIVKYHWKAGRKAQAMKTLFTLAKRAKEDYYKKK